MLEYHTKIYVNLHIYLMIDMFGRNMFLVLRRSIGEVVIGAISCEAAMKTVLCVCMGGGKNIYTI
jgi:hypothetical protein